MVNRKVVHKVKPGEIVGEMILWFGGVRQATVTATHSGFMATILMEELRDLSLSNPRVAMQLMKVMGQQSVNTYLKFRAAMLLKQPNVLNELIPLQSFTRAIPAETDAAWQSFIEDMRTDYEVSEQAALALKDRFAVYKIWDGATLLMPMHQVDFVLLVLRGSVAVNTPTEETYGEREFVCECAYFQADQSLPQKLEVKGVGQNGLVALMPFDEIQALCMAHPSLLYPFMLQLGQNAMAHARGERGVDVVAKQHDNFKKRRESQLAASDGADSQQQMEVFYRKRLEKMTRTSSTEELEKSAAKAERAAHKARTDMILLQKEVAALREETVKLREENQEMPKLRDRNAELEARHDEIVSLCRDQAKQLKESTREYFTEAIEKNSEVLDSYRRRAEFAEVELASLRAQVETLKTSHAEEKSQHEDLHERYSTLQANFAVSQQKLHALQTARTMQDLEAAEDHIQELDSDIQSLEEKNSALEQRLDDALSSQHANHARMKNLRKTSTFRSLVANDPRRLSTLAALHAARSTFEMAEGLEGPPGDGRRSDSLALRNHETAQLMTTLQEQTRDLQLQVETLEELQGALSAANMSMSCDCNTSAERIRDLQYKLALSEDLLLPVIAQMQQLQQSTLTQRDRIVALLKVNTRESRLRKALAQVALGACEALSDGEGGARFVPKKDAASTLAAMEAHTLLGPPGATPLATQLRLLSLVTVTGEATESMPESSKGPNDLAVGRMDAGNTVPSPFKPSGAEPAAKKAPRGARDAAALETTRPDEKVPGGVTVDATITVPQPQLIDGSARRPEHVAIGQAEPATSVGGWGKGGNRRGNAGLAQLIVSLQPDTSGGSPPKRTKPGLIQSTSSPAISGGPLGHSPPDMLTQVHVRHRPGRQRGVVPNGVNEPLVSALVLEDRFH